ncbi:hypothetical protein GPJ56_008576 [Histomonas meleagridis]|uniref:uncharacterized protein n=1 Tax=Histomonas meleagridis TaxID=135588 RepID=UPI003559608D|nr:hypothetical protein GPJ56_008576 [Histomonas meleagridis]KAH0805847.1 hypothetical protein GO595_001486 [Histomonas meleagridis]
MFDPQRIGPISESYYSRNKGRVLQRKLVPPLDPPMTKYDLDRAYEVIKNNGIVADYTVQNNIVNYPGSTSTKRIAYEVGSTIKVVIPISSIKLGTDSTNVFPLTQFIYPTGLNQSIDYTHYYVFICIQPNSPTSDYTLIRVNIISQSEISQSGFMYYYLYDFGTIKPDNADCTVLFLTSNESVVLVL